MSFAEESEMYDRIARFLEHRFPGCETVVNKIRFDMLKGWKIDVAGIIHKESKHIIAVEAKNDLSPENVLQGISQAEMYQKACNEALIALPADNIEDFKKNSRDDWERITDLCKLKGIGIISVAEQWEDCRVLHEAMRVQRYNDLYDDILNQLEYETLKSFGGFEELDFDYFIGRADQRESLVKKKIELLVKEIKSEMLANPRDFPAVDPKKLVISLPSTGFRKGGCWFFASEVEKKKLAYFPHFTFHVDNDGVSCALNLGESAKTTKTLIAKTKKDTQQFLEILRKLSKIDENYMLKIWEQIPEKGKPRRPQWSWHTICSFNAGYLDKDTFKVVLELLAKKKYPIIRILCPQVGRGDSTLYSREIVNICTTWVKELQDAYSFFTD
jgi:hypothetical protein